MSIIIEVPTMPFRAGRHLAAWIAWHSVRVSWMEDEAPDTPRTSSRTRRNRRTKTRAA